MTTGGVSATVPKKPNILYGGAVSDRPLEVGFLSTPPRAAVSCDTNGDTSPSERYAKQI